MPYAANPNDGVRIHYEVEGSGLPLLLHCGFMGRLEDWYLHGYVDALRDEYQLILIDPRGQGRSDKPHDVESYGIQVFVDDIVAVLDALDVKRTHFLGYSMGGQTGFAAGVFAPDRFLSLILGGSHPYFDQQTTILKGSLREEAQVLARGMVAFLDRCQEMYGPPPPDIRKRWLDNDGKALAANTLALETFPDITEQLAETMLPTLVYCGTADETFTKAKQASLLMPNARFLALEDLEHIQVFRQSEVIVPHIRAFLSEVGVPA